MNELITITDAMLEDFQELMNLGETIAQKYDLKHMTILLRNDAPALTTVFDDEVTMNGKNIGFFAHDIESGTGKVHTGYYEHHEEA